MKFWGYSSPNSAFCQQNSPCCCSAHVGILCSRQSLWRGRAHFLIKWLLWTPRVGILKPKNILRAVIAFMFQGMLREEELSPGWKAIFRMKPGVVIICKQERNKNLRPSVRTKYSQEGDCKLWNGTWDFTLLTGAVQHQVGKSWILKTLLFAVSVLVLGSWWPHLNWNVQGLWDNRQFPKLNCVRTSW